MQHNTNAFLEQLLKGVTWSEAMMQYWFDQHASGIEKWVNGQKVLSKGIALQQGYTHLFDTVEFELSDGQYKIFTRKLPEGRYEATIRFVQLLDKLVNERDLLKEAAVQDPLTKSLNRKGLQDWFEERIRQFSDDIGFVLVMFDLDNFKQLNDSQGHAVGDEALRAIADTFRSSLRNFDVFARIGGDEFVLILEACSCHPGIKERLQEIVKRLPLTRYGLGITMGVTCYPCHGNDLNDLIKHADSLLYLGKRRGKNQIVLWEEGVRNENAS